MDFALGAGDDHRSSNLLLNRFLRFWTKYTATSLGAAPTFLNILLRERAKKSDMFDEIDKDHLLEVVIIS